LLIFGKTLFNSLIMTNTTDSVVSKKIPKIAQKISEAKKELHKILIGQEDLVNRLFGALFVRGHILLEGVPGLAKTTAILALSKVCDLDFSRIQFTPDLLPSDVIGNQIFNPKTQEFSTKKGPIFTSLLLADEINRAPAKVQSALLEAMQERQITIGEETHFLPEIFVVLATQNPIEQEGTFPLPEAQVDRFFYKVHLDYPTIEEEQHIVSTIEKQDFSSIKTVFEKKDILEIQKLVDDIYADEVVVKYITQIIEATRNPEKYKLKSIAEHISFGASPRGSINLMRGAKIEALFNGRGFITVDDVKSVAKDVLRHRIVPSFEAEADNISSDDLIETILHTVPSP
jgi:MoxR-like ATPase